MLSWLRFKIDIEPMKIVYFINPNCVIYFWTTTQVPFFFFSITPNSVFSINMQKQHNWFQTEWYLVLYSYHWNCFSLIVVWCRKNKKIISVFHQKHTSGVTDICKKINITWNVRNWEVVVLWRQERRREKKGFCEKKKKNSDYIIFAKKTSTSKTM